MNLLSTWHGELPSSKVKRHDKKLKEYIETNRPKLIIEYKQHLACADLFKS